MSSRRLPFSVPLLFLLLVLLPAQTLCSYAPHPYAPPPPPPPSISISHARLSAIRACAPICVLKYAALYRRYCASLKPTCVFKYCAHPSGKGIICLIPVPVPAPAPVPVVPPVPKVPPVVIPVPAPPAPPVVVPVPPAPPAPVFLLLGDACSSAPGSLSCAPGLACSCASVCAPAITQTIAIVTSHAATVFICGKVILEIPSGSTLSTVTFTSSCADVFVLVKQSEVGIQGVALAIAKTGSGKKGVVYTTGYEVVTSVTGYPVYGWNKGDGSYDYRLFAPTVPITYAAFLNHAAFVKIQTSYGAKVVGKTIEELPKGEYAYRFVLPYC